MRVAANAVNAAWVRKGVHLEMKEAVAARRNSAGVSRALARARLVMKEPASFFFFFFFFFLAPF